MSNWQRLPCNNLSLLNAAKESKMLSSEDLQEISTEEQEEYYVDQFTKEERTMTLSKKDQRLIKLAAEGMKIANDMFEHSAQEDAYGGFYDALQRIMKVNTNSSEFLSDCWESYAVQGSLDLTDAADYPGQIKWLFEDLGAVVILE